MATTGFKHPVTSQNRWSLKVNQI